MLFDHAAPLGLAFPILLSLFLASLFAAAPGFAADNTAPQNVNSGNVLHVRVIDLRNSKGTVICTLFNSPEGFPTDDSKAVASATAPIQYDAGTCKFTGLARGDYALVVFHDENGNGKFDRDAIGLPEEEYGFSNDVKPEFAPPKFDDAAFEFKGGDQWLTIRPAN
jgi:uncharacterized protein (DUF2141 family)